MCRFRFSDLVAAGVASGGRIQLRWACAGMDKACLGLHVDPGFPIRSGLGSAWSLPGEGYGVTQVLIFY